eukprot:TRINITY_DN3399_c0_g1_i2.p3 TRINITY_DN3399_c0_g1~~TRINITY_DN3399_c0_g1_i2.p3  ORF type:complete len:103 (-),score=33.06 TRINITY_DN3399_c0_g1_i2:195-503(-)
MVDTAALTRYGLYFGLLCYQLQSQDDSLKSEAALLLCLVLLLFIKLLRIVALSTFGKWARKCWAPAAADATAQGEGAIRAPLQAAEEVVQTTVEQRKDDVTV